MNLNEAFHFNYIRSELKKRSAKNPQYSLRSFARDLGVAVSWLSEFLAGKKGMSLESANRLCVVLGLSPQEKDLFLLSTEAHHARANGRRKVAEKKIKKLRIASSFKMKDSDFVDAGTWHHLAILELLEVTAFEASESSIARRLGISRNTVKTDLEDLQKLGLLKMVGGRFVAQYEQTATSNDKPSAAMRAYHEQILRKAGDVLRESPVQEREFQTAIFAFDSERMEEAKEAIREFQKQFLERFYQADAKKDSVYQFSLQFFSLDKRGMK